MLRSRSLVLSSSRISRGAESSTPVISCSRSRARSPSHLRSSLVTELLRLLSVDSQLRAVIRVANSWHCSWSMPSSSHDARILDSLRLRMEYHSRAYIWRKPGLTSRYSPWSSTTSCGLGLGLRLRCAEIKAAVEARIPSLLLLLDSADSSDDDEATVAVVRASGSVSTRTRMFPGCGSEWTKPVWKIWRLKQALRSRDTSFGSMPRRLISWVSLILTPSSKVIVSTRELVSPQMILGVVMLGHSAKSAAKRSAFSASRAKLSSLGRFSLNSSSIQPNLNPGKILLTQNVINSIVSMSRLHIPVSPANCTLTASGTPSSSAARCTCASDAAAIGSGSKYSKIFSGGTPNSSVNVVRTLSNDLAGAWSCSLLSVVVYCGGRMWSIAARC
eukprot:comp20204_c0_seq1/m.39992 comp20204_c0_seq1/g.39992  ORF comp20204_c0_seq1/g.39992 comp20204_c0_seq1/m.39992 type:complete len:388 (-) comp20204_c0_seq1:374-1537(-)